MVSAMIQVAGLCQRKTFVIDQSGYGPFAALS